MAKLIQFANQIELPVAASDQKSAVRKQEFETHTQDSTSHIPDGGKVGQVLAQTASGLTWMYPKVSCSCGAGTVIFEELDQGTLAAPTGFVVTGQTTTTVSLSWTPADGVTGYHLQCSESTHSLWSLNYTISLASSGSPGHITVTGLQQGTTYDFQIRGVKDFSYSSWARVSGTTDSLPVPPAPANLSSPARSANSVTLSWSGSTWCCQL